MLKKVCSVFVLIWVLILVPTAVAAEKQPVGLVVKGAYSRWIKSEILSQTNPVDFYWSDQSSTVIYVQVKTGSSSKSRLSGRNKGWSGGFNSNSRPLFFTVYATTTPGKQTSIGRTGGCRKNTNKVKGVIGIFSGGNQSTKEFDINKLIRLLNSWQPPPRLYPHLTSEENMGKWGIYVGQVWDLYTGNQNIGYQKLATLEVASIVFSNQKGKYNVNFRLIKGKFDGIFAGRTLVVRR